MHLLQQPLCLSDQLLAPVVISRLTIFVAGEVVPGEHAQRVALAVAELYLAVHAAGPEERRVEPVDVVGGEHDEPLPDAGRPEPVDEVEHAGQADPLPAERRVRRHEEGARRSRVVELVVLAWRRRPCPIEEAEGAVDVLDDDERLGARRGEQPPEVGVGAHRGELEVVDVELEEVGDGRDEAGLAGARRAVEQSPALPRAAGARVVLPPAHEA